MRPQTDHVLTLGAGTLLTIHAGRVWRGRGWLEDVAIRIEGGRITRLAPSAEVPVQGELIDASDKWVVPGLVDAHVHVAGNSQRRAGARVQRLYALDLLVAGLEHESLAALGITTIRVAGGEPSDLAIALRENMLEGLLDGPRVVSVGSVIRPTEVQHPLSGDGLLRSMRRNFGFSADAALIGWCREHRRRLTLAELRLLAEEAKRRGIRLGLSPASQDEALDGVRAGVDLIEGVPADANAELVSALASSGAILVPLLAATRCRSSRRSATRAFVARAARSGVRVAVGSGWRPRAGLGAFSEEIRALLDCGLTSDAVLEAATKHGADALGIDNDIGSIQEGMSADLLLLTADPQADATVLAQSKHVWCVTRDRDPLLS